MELLEYSPAVARLIPDSNNFIADEEVAEVETLKEQGFLQKVDPATYAGFWDSCIVCCADSYHIMDKLQFAGRVHYSANGKPSIPNTCTPLGGALIFAPESDLAHFMTRKGMEENRDAVRVESRKIRYFMNHDRCQLLLATGHRVCSFVRTDLSNASLRDALFLLRKARANMEELFQVETRAWAHYCAKQYQKKRKFYEALK